MSETHIPIIGTHTLPHGPTLSLMSTSTTCEELGISDNHNRRPMVSVIGSRATSDVDTTRAITSTVSDLATTDTGVRPVIVSGLAVGADRMGHEYALDAHLPTIAVLPSGLGSPIYPSENAQLARRIMHSGGALASQFSTQAFPCRSSFLQRNQSIAALSTTMIIAPPPTGETLERSGTRNAVRHMVTMHSHDHTDTDATTIRLWIPHILATTRPQWLRHLLYPDHRIGPVVTFAIYTRDHHTVYRRAHH